MLPLHMNILAKPEGKNSPQNWKEEGKKKRGGVWYFINCALEERKGKQG